LSKQSEAERKRLAMEKSLTQLGLLICEQIQFTQLIWTSWFAKELVKHRKTSTLREVYYSARGQRDIEYSSQQESDSIITDLEVALNRAREDFHIFPEERSAIFGDLTIEYTVPGYEGRRTNLTDHPDGIMIGPAVTSSEFVETSADKVLVIEKGAMFTRLVEEQAHKRFNAILIHTAGQSPRSTRSIINRLNKEYGLPVYITDIIKYKLPTEPLTEFDKKRLQELKNDPRYKDDLWQRELDIYIRLEKKAELEAFSRYGLNYIVEKYLPDKLEGQ